MMRRFSARIAVMTLALTLAGTLSGTLSGASVSAATSNAPSLTQAAINFGDGTGGYTTDGNAQLRGDYALWVYDQHGALLNSSTSVPASINIPLIVGSNTFDFAGSYYPYNPIVANLANELTLSLNGTSADNLVIDDSANSGTPQNPQVTTTVINGYTVTVSAFTFTENDPNVDNVSPFSATPGPWNNSVGSFTLTVTHVPTSKSDCFHGGWTTLTDSSGTSFKNQGDCVSYVATRGRNLAG